MSDPFDKAVDALGRPLRFRTQNFGDAQLADRVIEAAAEGKLVDGHSFRLSECEDPDFR